MAIDILSVKPNVVSTNAGSYSTLIYGAPKSGKTTLVSRFPKCLVLATEKGYGAISGIMALPINSWGEFLQVLSQLKQLKQQETAAKARGDEFDMPYEVIAIDIIDILADYCEAYICAREGKDTLGDIAYGAGYKMYGTELDNKLRSIVQMGYGLVMVSHAQFVGSDDDGGVKSATPTLTKRPKNIVTRLVDNYIYAEVVLDTENQYQHIAHLRQTPYWEAGSRFKYMPEEIPLTYKALVAAIGEAVRKEAEENGSATTEAKVNDYAVEEVDFLPLKGEVMNIMRNIMASSATVEEQGEKFGQITQIVEEYLGKDRKVSEATEAQIDQLKLIRTALQEKFKGVA